MKDRIEHILVVSLQDMGICHSTRSLSEVLKLVLTAAAAFARSGSL